MDDDGINPFQAPTVLKVPRLPSQEVVTHLHREALQYLRQQPTRKIVLDALEDLSDDSEWTTNDSPQGLWNVLHILNQGSWNHNLARRHGHRHRHSPSIERLFHLVRNIPGLMEKCLFGNVMISKICPGTIIEPHCGPTNARHRLQFLVALPEDQVDSPPSSSSSSSPEDHTSGPCLFVGKDVQLIWSTQHDVFVFDDSFVHSVNFSPQKDGRQLVARIVLIVDLWNPDLDEFERTLLQHLYPPQEYLRVR
jgi:hypothetical protein